MIYDPQHVRLRVETFLGVEPDLADTLRGILDIVEHERLDPTNLSRIELVVGAHTDDDRPAMWEVVVEGYRTS